MLRQALDSTRRNAVAALAAALAAPVAACVLAARPSWRVGLSERLGRVPQAVPGSIWVHASSVGEALAASRLIHSLQQGGRPVFGSLTTASGREVLQRALPELLCSLAPVDHPWSVAAALDRIRPSSLILVETELWPSLVAGAKRRGVPVGVVSGRISDRSLVYYRRFRALIAPTLERLDCIGARSQIDAERFVELGAASERVRVTGDLKLDPPSTPPRLAQDLAQALSHVPLFVAGSTHSGEESAALSALSHCEAAGEQIALVLAPRDLDRVDEVEREVMRAGRVVRRRSLLADARLAAGEVLLLDTLGELAAVYSASTSKVAFVGGTLAKVGGHNVLEPVQAGCSVCFGPYTDNVTQAAGWIAQAGVGTPVRDAHDLGVASLALLRDPDRERCLSAANASLEAHRGSVARSIAMLQEIVHPGAPCE